MLVASRAMLKEAEGSLVFEAFVDIFGGQIVCESSSSDGRLLSDSSRLHVGSWLLLDMSFIVAKVILSVPSYCNCRIELLVAFEYSICFVQLSMLCYIVRCL